MIVNYQKPLRFRNKSECIFDPLLLEEAILWYAKMFGLAPVASLKDVFIHGVYPAISIGGHKLHVHRLIYSFKRQRFFMSNEHVHHKNGNKLDARLSNLELIDAGQHLSEHNAGKKLGLEHRRKIGDASRKRKGIKFKKKTPPS